MMNQPILLTVLAMMVKVSTSTSCPSDMLSRMIITEKHTEIIYRYNFILIERLT